MREYIGARYVPVFANPIEWDNLRSYEALTIVTYHGTSYTSKKPVPPGVDIGNGEYWAQTGNYNAQVEEYRNLTLQYRADVEDYKHKVDTLNTGLSFLANKKIVVYGDSISSEDTAPASTYQPSWVGRLREKVPESTTIVNKAVPGMYMTQSGGVATTIRDETTIDADIVIIFGGVNDFRHSRTLGTLSDADISTFGGALNVIRDALTSKAPNALVFVVSPLKSYETSYPSNHDNNLVLSFYRGMLAAWCNANGYNYIEGFNAPRLNPANTTLHDSFQPDGLHVNNKYSDVLCEYIMQKIVACDNMAIAPVATRLNIASKITAGTVSFAYADIDTNGICELIISGNVTADGSNMTIGTLPAYLLPNVSAQAGFHRQTGSTFDVGIASISATNGEIKVRTPESGTMYYSVQMRYSLKAFRSLYTNSR